jgi:hypothetical protein
MYYKYFANFRLRLIMDFALHIQFTGRSRIYQKTAVSELMADES